MRKLASLFTAVLLSACMQPSAEPPDSVPTPATAAGDRLVGTVRVVGSAPVNVRVVLEPRTGDTVELAGPLLDELRRLSGAEVEVTGRTATGAMPPAQRVLQVTDYEVVSVDGEPVISGTVEGTGGGWVRLRTSSGEIVYLAGTTEQFRAGQKIWVQGPRAVIVQTYGIIKP